MFLQPAFANKQLQLWSTIIIAGELNSPISHPSVAAWVGFVVVFWNNAFWNNAFWSNESNAHCPNGLPGNRDFKVCDKRVDFSPSLEASDKRFFKGLFVINGLILFAVCCVSTSFTGL